eukprot:m.74834 g.74834  ORF g.74834 m.74834 type:complete len:240 (+) comp35921_c0_seq4:1230-1949(+)
MSSRILGEVLEIPGLLLSRGRTPPTDRVRVKAQALLFGLKDSRKMPTCVFYRWAVKAASRYPNAWLYKDEALMGTADDHEIQLRRRSDHFEAVVKVNARDNFLQTTQVRCDLLTLLREAFDDDSAEVQMEVAAFLPQDSVCDNDNDNDNDSPLEFRGRTVPPLRTPMHSNEASSSAFHLSESVVIGGQLFADSPSRSPRASFGGDQSRVSSLVDNSCIGYQEGNPPNMDDPRGLFLLSS